MRPHSVDTPTATTTTGTTCERTWSWLALPPLFTVFGFIVAVIFVVGRFIIFFCGSPFIGGARRRRRRSKDYYYYLDYYCNYCSRRRRTCWRAGWRREVHWINELDPPARSSSTSAAAAVAVAQRRQRISLARPPSLAICRSRSMERFRSRLADRRTDGQTPRR